MTAMFCDEGGEAELLPAWTVAIRQFTAHCRSKEAVVAGQGRGDIPVEVRPLLEFDGTVAIGQPIRPRGDRTRHLLQAIDIGIDGSEIVDQRRVQHAAPDVKR